ncbi:MAG: hypothetical protein H7Z75_04165, partial [Ferruginibacter sp.]|nr:hypothetical protein [Cytophagales bacterium]
MTNRAHRLNLGGTNNAIGTFTTVALSASTVNYDRAGNQTVFVSSNYQDLAISGSGDKVLQGTTIANGSLTVSAGTLEVGAQILSVGGTTTISGTLNDNDNLGLNFFVGQVAVNAGGSLTTASNSTFEFRGGIRNDGTFSQTGTGNVTFSTNSPQIITGTAAIVLTGNVIINNGITVTNQNTNTVTLNGSLNGANGASTWANGANATLNYLNAAQPMATGTLTTTSPNLVIYGGAGQSVKPATYHNLTIAGSGTKTLAGNATVNNNLAVNAGTLDFGTPARTVTVGGDLSGGGTISMAGVGLAHVLNLGGTNNAIGAFTTTAASHSTV